MRRLALIFSVLVAGASAFAVAATADDSREYTIEMYNAFGIVEGSDVRVSGVNAGSVQSLDVNSAKRAVITVKLSGPLAVLGENTECHSAPQSLIAEYFLDCTPDGPEIEPSDDPENPDIPAEQVQQTVQPDLVQNTLREPFKRRLQLLINEFGTALAGNAENLNEAIRLGAPALTQLEKVLKIMGDQNTIIRDLNVNSDRIIARLTERREDVVRFIEEARDTAAASAERRDDLSRDFALLDDFLFELKPTLADLEVLAREQTPLLTDLDASAPGLNNLVLNLPAFNQATQRSLSSLGDASNVGKRALNQGKEEIDALADAGENVRPVAEILADLFRDLDDPKRAVEADTRAADDTGRAAPTGYTGLEGLLNYGYYQAGALNQFDQVGHLLHFSLYYIFTGPCGEFSTGRDPVTGEPRLPNQAGGFTSTPTLAGDDSTQIPDCMGWLGPNQPGITEDSGLGSYQGGPDPPECTDNSSLPQCTSVCPAGVSPNNAAALALCDPSMAKRSASEEKDAGQLKTKNGGASASGEPGATPDNPGLPGLPNVPDLPGGLPDNPSLDDLLDLPRNLLNSLPDRLQDRVRDLRNSLGGNGGGGGSGGGSGGGGGGSGGGSGGGGNAVNDLLDFLLGP